MNIFGWLKSLVSSSGKAVFLYKRGMKRATNGEHERAIEDYTAALEIKGIQPKVRAMAWFNRALAHVANNDNARAVEDLLLVLDMEDELPHIKKMAKQKLMRIDRRA